MKPFNNLPPKATGSRPATGKCQGAACVSNHAGHATAAGAASRLPARQAIVQPVMPGRKPVSPPVNPARKLAATPTAAPVQTRPTAHNHRPPTTGAAQPPRATASRPNLNTPQRVENRAQTVINRNASQAPNASAASAPAYVVHAPPAISGSGQQIRATIKGTPQVAGSLDIKPIGGGKVYISNLTVERQHRRQGLANQLMSAAMAAARNHGFSGAQLEARPSDTGITSQALVAMYQRLGFKSVGKTKRGNPLMERRF